MSNGIERNHNLWSGFYLLTQMLSEKIMVHSMFLQGRVDMVEYLVRTAAVLELDLNHVDHDGANVLFYCAASGRLNLLRLLLKVILIDSKDKWSHCLYLS